MAKSLAALKAGIRNGNWVPGIRSLGRYLTDLNPRSLAANTAHDAAQIVSLISGQIRRCGCFYTFREYLKIILLFNLPAHLMVSRALALPRVSTLHDYHPRAAFKYLRDYLAHGLCTDSRAAILANHYRCLDTHVAGNFINRICAGRIVLWEEFRGTSRFGIALSYPHVGHKEGELTLVFLQDTLPLFTLSFTLASGKQLDVADGQVLFIGRLQGANGSFESIKQTTILFEDISPAALLLAAARAIAMSLDIPGIAGVTAQAQISIGGKLREAIPVYDDFWIAAGAKKINDYLFHLPTVAAEKPLSMIKNNHRSRVKRKRQFKHALTEQVCRTFKQECLN